MGIAKKLKSAISYMYWAFCRLFPLKKNKIVVSSCSGRGYGDNPKPIVAALLARLPKADIVWICGSAADAATLPAGVRPCRYGSPRRIYELSTAAVWIDNNRKGARIKRKGQFYLQTWHGFALKRIEKDVFSKLPPDYEAFAMRDSAQIDLFVSDSAFMTDIYRRAFCYSGEIAELGAPRNDVFFADTAPLRAKVCRALGVPPEHKLVLYAPTFRADRSLAPYSVDFERLRKACEKRFGGEFTALVRLHPMIMKLSSSLTFDGATFDASAYPDMQELLAAADVVVSDYSSLMFDFALTRRPCFQFCTDIAAYRLDRNFYIPLDTLPFPLAEDNDGLEGNILGFNAESYGQALDGFMKKYNIVANGRASERCADRVIEFMNRNQPN